MVAGAERVDFGEQRNHQHRDPGLVDHGRRHLELGDDNRRDHLHGLRPVSERPRHLHDDGGGLWEQVGTITPNGDGSYNPNTGYTPTATGTYWYFASYAGDTTNNAASSLCNSGSMAKTVVTSPPDTFGISAIGASQTAGSAITIATITAQLYGGGTDTTYTGVKTLVFSARRRRRRAMRRRIRHRSRSRTASRRT